ncbi:MAG: type pilus assembly protein PilA [Actinomycetota bacterium]|jgi:type II secretory pathway pseudopilin PulG|nr:type pilus assembly protein PilA [Actinomycetota bacterium]
MTVGRTTPWLQRALTSTAAATRGGHGYSLVELMVILLVIALLLIIGLPALLGSQERSQDRAVQSDITHVFSVEKIIYSGHATYTDDIAAMGTEEPSFIYVAADTPAATGPVYLYLAPGNTIYIMAQSLSGTCYYLRDADGTGTDYAASASCGRSDLQTYAPAW